MVNPEDVSTNVQFWTVVKPMLYISPFSVFQFNETSFIQNNVDFINFD